MTSLTDHERENIGRLCEHDPVRTASAIAAYTALRSEGVSAETIFAMIRTHDLDDARQGPDVEHTAFLQEFRGGEAHGATASISFGTARESKSYDQYITSLLYKIKKNAHIGNTDDSLKQAALRLLIQIGLADKIQLHDMMAIASGEAIPNRWLRLVLNRTICAALGERYDYVEDAWRVKSEECEAQGLQEIGVGLPADQEPYFCMQRVFAMERRRNKLTQSDIGGLLKLSPGSIGKAEWPGYDPTPIYYQSQQTAAAYSNGNKAAQRQLERIAHEVFFPEGITDLPNLIKCIAYKNGSAIEPFGASIGIDRLTTKLNPGEHGRALSVRDVVTLRKVLHAYTKKLSHIGLDEALIDRLLVDPLSAGDKDFATLLNNWAELACETRKNFAREVSATKDAEISPKILYDWGKGTGLAGNLDAIISVLKTNAQTKEIFPLYEASFIKSAKTMIPDNARPGRRVTAGNGAGPILAGPSQKER